MATFPTWATLKARIQADLDISAEDFVSEADLLRYANAAINELEQEVITVYPDYFLTYDTVTLADGTDEYDMPSDIYQNKVRRVLYKNGSKRYTVHRCRDWLKFEKLMESNINANAADPLQWFPVHRTAGSPKMLFAPTPQESGEYIKRWYIRNANALTGDSSVMDIAEGTEFVIAVLRMHVRAKENGGQIQPGDRAEVEYQKELFMDNLIDMVPDADNELEPDMSHYDASI